MLSWKRAAAFAATLALVLAVAGTAEAGKKKFMSDDDSKKDGEATEYLKNYDKLMEGDEADWVFVGDAAAVKAAKSVKVEEFETNARGKNKREGKDAAEDGKQYLVQWIEENKKLGWSVAKGGGDLTLRGNVFDAWEPSHRAPRSTGAAGPRIPGWASRSRRSTSPARWFSRSGTRPRAPRSATPWRTASRTW
jgi:hypothetical protein